MASRVIQTRVSAAKRQVNTLKDFLTTPKGIFETADQIVKNFRRANRETLSSLGIRGVPKIGMGISAGTLGTRLRRKLRELVGGGL